MTEITCDRCGKPFDYEKIETLVCPAIPPDAQATQHLHFHRWFGSKCILCDARDDNRLTFGY